MFANQTLAIRQAEQFAMQQRARDIALKGHSDIELLRSPRNMAPASSSRGKSPSGFKGGRRKLRRNDLFGGSSHSHSLSSRQLHSQASDKGSLASPSRSKSGQDTGSGTPTTTATSASATPSTVKRKLKASVAAFQNLIRGPPLAASNHSHNHNHKLGNRRTDHSNDNDDDSSVGSQSFFSDTPQQQQQQQQQQQFQFPRGPGMLISTTVRSFIGSSSRSILSSNDSIAHTDVDCDNHHYVTKTEKLEEELEQQTRTLEEYRKRIMHHVQLAHARTTNSTSTIGVCLSLRTVHQVQREYLNTKQMIAAFQELQSTHHHLSTRSIDKSIQELHAIQQSKRMKTPKREHDDEYLLNELQRKLKEHDGDVQAICNSYIPTSSRPQRKHNKPKQQQQR